MDKNKVPQISEAEWKVMKILWTKHPRTAKEIIDELLVYMPWKPKTVKTLLGRLVKKGVLNYTVEGRSYHYYPEITEEACVKAESNSFLDKVYDGSLNIMLANLISDKQLSNDDIQELKDILDKKQK